MSTRAKFTDAKGRVSLGAKFANKAVLIREVDETETVVTLARIMPEREAWLYENPAAKAAVYEGLQQACAQQFAQNPPDIATDAEFADKLDGEA
ncbi:hypothetical protein BH09PLA1_BH09PLA1_29350 [soil metagenome]